MARRSWPAAVTGGAVVGAVTALARRGVVRFAIAEASMSPALLPGDFVIAQKGALPYRRGDMVVYRHPRREDFELVKRVIGLPGEIIQIAAGQVHVQGRVLAEPWADGPTLPDSECHVGPSELFVLGDRRASSADDGRALGPVPFDAVVGTVRFRYWPPRRFGRV